MNSTRNIIVYYFDFPYIPVFLMKVPSRYSLKASSSSASVFITIGPYQAIGSCKGLPEINSRRVPALSDFMMICMIVLTIYLIYELDSPFSGSLQIDPKAFNIVYEKMVHLSAQFAK